MYIYHGCNYFSQFVAKLSIKKMQHIPYCGEKLKKIACYLCKDNYKNEILLC